MDGIGILNKKNFNEKVLMDKFSKQQLDQQLQDQIGDNSSIISGVSDFQFDKAQDSDSLDTNYDVNEIQERYFEEHPGYFSKSIF